MSKHKIGLMSGDITALPVDAIVNAANSELLNGGGVNGAIHQAAGPELLEACEKLGGCQTGQAKVTKGFKLPARLVIHTVGPVWRGGAKGEPQLLASCYANSLQAALEHQAKIVAFPAISCGVYGFPVSQAATIAVKETANFLELHPEIEKVIFVCFDDIIHEAYQHALDSMHHE